MKYLNIHEKKCRGAPLILALFLIFNFVIAPAEIAADERKPVLSSAED